METINHECYVSLEVAKLLKEAGFDCGCRGYYDRKVLRFNFVWDHNGKGASTQCSAPTLEVAQRWLREVKNISIEIERYETPHPLARELFNTVYEKNVGKTFAYRVNVIDSDEESIYDNAMFDAYEQAQEAGIKKALELILEKIK